MEAGPPHAGPPQAGPPQASDPGALRTPLIAGNWKMYKTEAQAEVYVQALLPRVSSVEPSSVRIVKRR